MRLLPCLILLALACSDSDPAGELGPMVDSGVLPVTGRWVGTSAAGEAVDVELTEIVRDVGGQGTVVRGGEVIEVGVAGRHEGNVVTLRFSAPGEGWNFQGTVSDESAREIRGRWTTFLGSFSLDLNKCVPGANFC